MKRYLALFFAINILCTCFCIHASINCNVVTDRNYAPLFIPNENDSIMNVRINLIFIQKDDGTGNFQANDSEHQNLLNDAMTILNEKISSLKMPGADCFSGTESELISDTRIRFVDHRYYIRCSSVWDNGLHVENYAHLRPSTNPWYLDHVDADSINNVLPDTLKGINIYFTEDSTIYNHFWVVQDTTDTSNVWTGHSQAASANFPSHVNLHKSSRIHIPCMFSKYWWIKNIVPQLESEHHIPWLYNGYLIMAGSIAGSMAHELGHSFNLNHPREDLSHIIYPDTGCMATIMQPSWHSPRNFLPPQEIGMMYFSSMTTNLQQFIPSNTYLGTKLLQTTVTLPRMRMYYSLLIGASGNVTMPCDITFSPQGYIEVQNGGELSINGAVLQSVQNSWGGITVQSGGTLKLSDVIVGDFNITIKSGGCLIINDDLTIQGDHRITIEDGGYLCIASDASVNLQNEFSVIIISPNVHLGCPSCSENCITSYSDLSHIGDGRFEVYEEIDFVQNITITSDYLVMGDTVYAGYDVTSTKPVGDVKVEDGGSLIIQANEAFLTKDVEVKLGGELKIQ